MDSVNIFKGKTILITGNTGFKGTWLTLWLMQLGAKVVGYSKDIPFRPSLFEAIALEKRIHQYWGDVSDLNSLMNAFNETKPDGVFHLAAQPLVRYSYDEPVETFRSNVLGTVHVLEAIRKSTTVKSSVMITTDKVYSNQEWIFSYRENDRLGGHDPYSGSKAACELSIQSYFQSYFRLNPEVSISTGRAGNVIGGGDYSVDRLIPDAVRAWCAKKPVTIRNPDSVRPWQHVLEPLSGYLKLAETGFKNPGSVSGEAFNFAPWAESGGKVHEVLSELQKNWSGFQFNIEPVSDAHLKKETTLLRLNFDKSKTVLGWSPRLKLQEAIQWTASWYAEFIKDPKNIETLTLEQIKDYGKRSSILT